MWTLLSGGTTGAVVTASTLGLRGAESAALSLLCASHQCEDSNQDVQSLLSWHPPPLPGMSELGVYPQLANRYRIVHNWR